MALMHVPVDVRRVLVFAHNPGLKRLSIRLVGDGSEPTALGRLQAKFPTAGLAEFYIETNEWRDIALDAGKLIRFSTLWAARVISSRPYSSRMP